MNLITPALAIAGACAVAIPIIIHLLARQRRKPIEWAAMRFLLEAFRKHRRRLQLEQIILLAVRCMIVGLLGLALARPILEGVGLIEPGGARAIYLVIDDGMASGVVDPERGESALAAQVQQATELVNSLGPGDTVGLITAARPARAVLNPPSGDHGAVIDMLRSLTPGQSPTDLHGAVALVRDIADRAQGDARKTLVYLFSEFREGSASLDQPLPPTNIDQTDQIALLASSPADRPVSNVQIVAIDPVRSVVQPGATDGSDRVTVRLRRTGGGGSDVTRVRLASGPDSNLPAIAPRTVQWTPGQAEAELEFIVDFGPRAAAGSTGPDRGAATGPGVIAAREREVGLIASIDADALEADNGRQAVVEVRHRLRVLMIDRRSFGFERGMAQLTAGQWIRRALEPLQGGAIEVVEVEPAALDVADLRPADVAIAPRPDLISDTGWRLVRDFIGRGGLLITMPPGEVNVHQWTTRMVEALNLPWRLALETIEHPDGLLLADQQPVSEFTKLISSELAELAGPVVTVRTLPVDRAATQATTILQFADGSPMMIAGTPATGPAIAATRAAGAGGERSDASVGATTAQPASSGLVVYFTVAPELNWTSLPNVPLMVPLFHETIWQGLSIVRGSQKILVGDQPAFAPGSAARDLVSPAGERVPIDASGRAAHPLRVAGLFNLNDASGQPVGEVAVNVDPSAGQTEVQSVSAVQTWLKASGPWTTFEPAQIAATLGGGAMGSPISGALLIAVLALVILETMLARWFSHAYREEKAARSALTA